MAKILKPIKNMLSFFSSRTIVLVAQQSADHLLNCNRIFYNILGILSVDGSLSGAHQSFCSFIEVLASKVAVAKKITGGFGPSSGYPFLGGILPSTSGLSGSSLVLFPWLVLGWCWHSGSGRRRDAAEKRAWQIIICLLYTSPSPRDS